MMEIPIDMNETSKYSSYARRGSTLLQPFDQCLMSEDLILITDIHSFYQVTWETVDRAPLQKFAARGTLFWYYIWTDEHAWAPTGRCIYSYHTWSYLLDTTCSCNCSCLRIYCNYYCRHYGAKYSAHGCWFVAGAYKLFFCSWMSSCLVKSRRITYELTIKASDFRPIVFPWKGRGYCRYKHL